MEITLKAKVAVWVYRSVEVNTIDDLRDAEADFNEDVYQMGRLDAEHGEIEYETGDFIKYTEVEVEDDYTDYGNVEDFIDVIYDDPDQPLHGTADKLAPIDFNAGSNDVPDAEAESADGIVDAIDANPAPSNIIHIPQPPKCNRRAGFDAFKHAFKKLARRF